MKVTGTESTTEGQSLQKIQTQIEVAAKAVNFSRNAMRQNAEKTIPDEVTNREKAAAKSERRIERTVLRRQARQARATDTVKCNLMPSKEYRKERP